jgi:hypothetical protein
MYVLKKEFAFFQSGLSLVANQTDPREDIVKINATHPHIKTAKPSA